MFHQEAMGVARSTRPIAEMFNNASSFPQSRGDGMAKPLCRWMLHEAAVCDLCETTSSLLLPEICIYLFLPREEKERTAPRHSLIVIKLQCNPTGNLNNNAAKQCICPGVPPNFITGRQQTIQFCRNGVRRQRRGRRRRSRR